MAKTFSIVERTTGPANPTANKIAGGSLAANTTYYYKLQISLQVSNDYYTGDSTLSYPSAEFSFTTDTTNKTAQIYFDNSVTLLNANQGYVYVYRTKTSGNYKQTSATGTATPQLVPLTGNDTAMANGLTLSSANCYKVYTFTTGANVATLVPGETITEQTSGATAIVVSNPAGGTTFKVRSITGSWNNTYNFDGSTTGANLGKWSSTSALVGYCVLDTIADGSLLTLPLLTYGCPTVYVSGGTSGSPTTPQDIYEWLVAQGKTQYVSIMPAFETGDYRTAAGADLAQYHQWRFHLFSTPSTSGYIRFCGNIFVHHLWGKFVTDSSTTVDFGKFTATGNGLTNTGTAYVSTKPYALYSALYGPVNIYASYVGGALTGDNNANSSLCNRDAYFQWAAGQPAKIYDSVYQATGRLLMNYDIQRSRMETASAEMANSTVGIFQGTFDSDMRNTYSYTEVIFKDVTILPNSSADVYSYGYGSGAYLTDNLIINHFINPTWAHATPVMLQNTQVVQQPSDGIVTEEFGFTLAVVNGTGTAISGATVTMVDKNGKNQIVTPSGSKLTTWAKKTGTSWTIDTGTLTVGNTYRMGLERVLVTAGTGTGPYTVTRATDGTTANNTGYPNTTTKYLPLYLVNPSVTTDGSGIVSCNLLARYWAVYNNSVSNYDFSASVQNVNPYIIKIMSYGKQYYSYSKTASAKSADKIVLTTDTYNVASFATANAYTGITIDWAGGNITVSSNHTLQELYDYCKAQNIANPSYAQPITTTDGINYALATNWNLIVNTGITVTATGKKLVMSGTGTYTMTGTGDFTGILADATTTRVKINTSGIVAGSRLQIYDLTASSELFNDIVAGTSNSFVFIHTGADHSIRIRLMYVSGATTAYYWYTATGTVTNTGLTFNVVQIENTIYETANIDGSLVTSCSISGATIRIYVNDPVNNTITAQSIYNWYQYYLSTALGIANQNGTYVTATDATHYIFTNTMKIINSDTANPLNITGANITPVSGAATNIFDLTNGASIALNFNRVEGFSYSSGSGLSTEEHDAVLGTKTTVDTNLDKKISQIPQPSKVLPSGIIV